MSAGLAFLLIAAQPSSPVPAEEAPAEEPPVVVTGTPDRPEQAAPLGSRIVRSHEPFGNGQIATGTGTAGLVPGSGMDPFAGGSKRVETRECRSHEVRLSASTVCLFAELQDALRTGDFAAARTRLERIMARPDLADEERYLAYWHAYSLAQADGGDDVDRREALEGMLGTTSMPETYRAPALRSLVAIALRSGDRAGATSALERVVRTIPLDARSRANLAALYDEQGRRAEAVRLLREAIEIVTRTGSEVPPEWAAFVAERMR